MNFRLPLDYLCFLSRSVTEHSIHSPYVFEITTCAIRASRDRYNHESDILSCRKSNLHDRSEIEVTDYGTAYGQTQYRRTIASIARHSSKPVRYCRLLYRLVAFLKPSLILELGTSFGYSTLYMAAAAPVSEIVTIEGCPNTLQVAKRNFEECRLSHIQSLNGKFDDLLPSFLQNHKPDFVFIDGNHTYEATVRYFHYLRNGIGSDSVLVFDDIYWSEGMKKAWREIKNHPDVTTTIDVFLFGIVFFKKGLTKQHFTIRV